MNKQRRKKIEALVERLADIWTELEELKDEEQDYFDNMPESFQGSDKGEAAEQVVSQLDDAINSACEAKDTLENIE